MPAQIQKVLDVTGKPKVTVIGYSQGSAQNIYGLAKKQDFFAERVNRFIAVAPCFASNPYEPYPSIAYKYKFYEDTSLVFKPMNDGSDQKKTYCNNVKR